MLKIHYSAKFEGVKFKYHGEFEIDARIDQVEPSKDRITSIAIGKLKKKCEENFIIAFDRLIFFEVYYYDKGKEVQIFKKVKEV